MSESRGAFGRVRMFVALMFPVFPAQIATFGSFALNYIVVSRLFLGEAPVLMELLLGGISMVLFNLQLRVLDELKDQPTDRIHFPQRPLVTGAVSRRDLRNLLLVLNLILLGCQLPFLSRAIFPAYLFVLAYSFLTFKWFFMETRMRKSLMLAFFSHHPLIFIFQIYLLTFFGRLSRIPMGAWLYVAGVTLAGTTWEIGRKMRGTSQETAYSTYTGILGVNGAAAVWSSTLTASLCLAFFPIAVASPSQTILLCWVLPGGACALGLWKALCFVRRPELAPQFRQIAEFYGLTLIIAALATGLFGV